MHSLTFRSLPVRKIMITLRPLSLTSTDSDAIKSSPKYAKFGPIRKYSKVEKATVELSSVLPGKCNLSFAAKDSLDLSKSNKRS